MHNFISRSLDELVEFQKKSIKNNENRIRSGIQGGPKTAQQQNGQLSKPPFKIVSPNVFSTSTSQKIKTKLGSEQLNSFLDTPLDEVNKLVKRQDQKLNKRRGVNQRKWYSQKNSNLISNNRQNISLSKGTQNNGFQLHKKPFDRRNNISNINSLKNQYHNQSIPQKNKQMIKSKFTQKQTSFSTSKNHINNSIHSNQQINNIKNNTSAFSPTPIVSSQLRKNQWNNMRRAKGLNYRPNNFMHMTTKQNIVNMNKNNNFAIRRSSNILQQRKLKKQNLSTTTTGGGVIAFQQKQKPNITISNNKRLVNKRNRHTLLTPFIRQTHQHQNMFLYPRNKARKNMVNLFNTSLNRSKLFNDQILLKKGKNLFNSSNLYKKMLTSKKYKQANNLISSRTLNQFKNKPFTHRNQFTNHPQLSQSNISNINPLNTFYLNQNNTNPPSFSDTQLLSGIHIMTSLDKVPDPLLAQRHMITPSGSYM